MFSRKIAVQMSGILRVAYMHAVSSGPDLPIGYISLSLGPQDLRGHGRRQRGEGGQWCPPPHLNSEPSILCLVSSVPSHVWSISNSLLNDCSLRHSVRFSNSLNKSTKFHYFCHPNC